MPGPYPVDVTKALLFFIARASAGASLIHDVADLFSDDISEEKRIAMASALTGSLVVGLFAVWTSLSDSYVTGHHPPVNKVDHASAMSKAFLLCLARMTACYSVLRYCLELFTEENTWINVAGLSFAVLMGSWALLISTHDSHRYRKNNASSPDEENQLLGSKEAERLIAQIKDLEERNKQLEEKNTQLLAEKSRFLLSSSSSATYSTLSIEIEVPPQKKGAGCVLL